MIAGRYRVLSVLGEGASARTLLCEDVREPRRVAIKELHFEHLDDWKHLELFEREAKVLSLLDHPGIPKVLDSFHDQTDSSSVYIVQEFIEGASLKQRMDSGPMLGQEEVHACAEGILEVLDYLHGRAPPVLHRDIKPSNILLRDDGSIALVDFGGVRFGWRPPTPQGATVVGTFGYMPPEQLVGQAGPTSDLYAVGATLLHLVTGRPPTDFPFDSGRIEIPSDLPAPPDLVRLLDALLRPAPRDRPNNAAEALRVLRGQGQNLVTASPTQVVEGGAQPPRSAALAPVRVKEFAITSSYGPRFVDVGPPPRNHKGEFKDVYMNLMSPLFPHRRLWSMPMHLFWLGLSVFAAISSFGIAALVYGSTVESRKRRYQNIFADGETTDGVIRRVDKGAMYATFKYEYEVAGERYASLMEYAVEMAQFWGEGDVVPVLYDPEDPRHSCFVYR